jgi:hypothetical protein
VSVTLDEMSDGAGTVAVAGKIYHLRKMSGGDYGRLRAWVKSKLGSPFAAVKEFQDANRPRKDDPPEVWAEYEADRRALLLECKAEYDLGDNVLHTPKARRVVASLQGMAFLLWLAASADRPGLKIEELERDLDAAPLGTFREVQEALDRASALPDRLVDAMEKKDPAVPATARQSA